MKFYKQETEWTCGPAAMRMVLNNFGISKSEKSLIKLMKTTKKRGTNDKEFPKVAEKYNLHSIVKKNAKIKDISRMLKEDFKIIICYYDSKGKYGHYAIVNKINKKQVYLIDPDYKSISFPINQFKTIWHGTKTPKRWYIAIKKTLLRNVLP